MKYLICQEFTITRDNHAGIKHLCKLLKINYPTEYEVITFPDLYQNVSKNKFIRKIQNLLIRNVIVPFKYLIIGLKLKKKLTQNDSIFLLEYCELLFPQFILAKYLRITYSQIKIYGLIHLVPEKLENSFGKKRIKKWINPLNKVLTFGTSLSNYLIHEIKIPKTKISTLFHYVDLDYYSPKDKNHKKEKSNTLPSIIVMGNQKRNFELLLDIVKKNSEINFTIFQGVIDLNEKFKECRNAKLIGFVDEHELLSVMQNSDISLNIMDDTIGSNVITTSMAVGMAMIVSDVGSIRDYCKNDGAIYCKNDASSFSDGIKDLLENPEKMNELKKRSILYSKNLSIQNFNNAIINL